MTDLAIRVEHLSKRYRIGQYVGSGAQYKTLRESLTNAVSAPLRRLRRAQVRSKQQGANSNPTPNTQHPTPKTIWALKDVSFEVKRGEVLGIIGRNGAGKSTLLKVLTRITEPTEGRAELNGRVGSLLEVGTGFHPELTGRENVYLSGAILGMARKEIDRKFDEIVDFSGVEKFIDTPVKRYSSGMCVRLGFAVAAHLEPEILLIDEVLAVGDLQFRRKCLGKMKDVSQVGRTVLFVSHNMSHIRQLCERVIWLEQGSIHESGTAGEVCSDYEKQAIGLTRFENPVTRKTYFHSTYEGPKIERVELRATNGELCNEFAYGDSFDLVVPLSEDSKPIEKEYSAIWFLHNERGEQLAVGWSFPMDRVVFTSDDHILICRIGPLSLPSGVYSFRIVLHVPHYEMFDNWPDAISFRIARCDPFGTGYDYPGIHTASAFVPHKWRSLPRNRDPEQEGLPNEGNEPA